jgi:hypothetical protein
LIILEKIKKIKILKCLPARISLIILEGIKLLNFEMNACKIDNSLIILETITIVKILKYPSARISLIIDFRAGVHLKIKKFLFPLELSTIFLQADI